MRADVGVRHQRAVKIDDAKRLTTKLKGQWQRSADHIHGSQVDRLCGNTYLTLRKHALAGLHHHFVLIPELGISGGIGRTDGSKPITALLRYMKFDRDVRAMRLA